jgi:hypothetical protein
VLLHYQVFLDYHKNMADFSSVQPLEDKATSLESQATTAQASGQTLADKLRTAVNERFANNPISQQREGALSTYLQAPDQARAAVASKVNSGIILSPSEQQSIMSGIKSNATVPLVSLNDLLKSTYGSIGDIVNAGTNAYNAQTQNLIGQAGVARTAANSALDRMYKEEQLNLERAKMAPKPPSAIEQLLAQMLSGQGAGAPDTVGGGQQSAQMEQKPVNTPDEDFQQRVTGQIHSPSGQWIYNRQIQSWQPSSLPEQHYQNGDTVHDPDTGSTLVFNGTDWVEQTQYQAPQQKGWLQSIFGG